MVLEHIYWPLRCGSVYFWILVLVHMYVTACTTRWYTHVAGHHSAGAYTRWCRFALLHTVVLIYSCYWSLWSWGLHVLPKITVPGHSSYWQELQCEHALGTNYPSTVQNANLF